MVGWSDNFDSRIRGLLGEGSSSAIFGISSSFLKYFVESGFKMVGQSCLIEGSDLHSSFPGQAS